MEILSPLSTEKCFRTTGFCLRTTECEPLQLLTVATFCVVSG